MEPKCEGIFHSGAHWEFCGTHILIFRAPGQGMLATSSFCHVEGTTDPLSLMNYSQAKTQQAINK